MNYTEESEQVSLLFRGIKYGGWVKNPPDDIPDCVSDLLCCMRESDEFDFVRGTERFVEIVKKL